MMPNYAQVVIAGYPRENRYGIQLQLKEINNRGFSKPYNDHMHDLSNKEIVDFDTVTKIRDSFSNVKLIDKKVVLGQEVFTYKVDLDEALNRINE